MIVIADGKTTEAAQRSDDHETDDHENLWLKLDELPAATGWQMKPEGACLGELCVPLPESKRAEWTVDTEDGAWLNYSEFADMIGQKQAHDGDVWSLSSVPEVRRSGLESAIAPDFEVAERNGDTLRLSDLRGRKVVLFTWSSW
ncbi:MAG: redoxin domain-containing protein [Acidimicrobiaceae bacterium]|nr:redoxin domain-containing protein [Acidimicrobiaceae bacterium]MCY4175144.1 redoxin domain-containing protein [Acidimicrobiaceae bacterium]MCY4280075.1 redoxin domain-containing protein [Acidimicrobiaceae bacterium]MCY4294122.1 redoxin domain-containing protein [Acidimicrobiaceae bacterium]